MLRLAVLYLSEKISEEIDFESACKDFIIETCKINQIEFLSLIYAEVYLDDNEQIQVVKSKNYEKKKVDELCKLVDFDFFWVFGDRTEICFWSDSEGNLMVIYDDRRISISSNNFLSAEDSSSRLIETDLYEVFIEANSFKTPLR